MFTDDRLGMIGLCGGLLCAVADILLDLKGKGNQKHGPGGVMDSNWAKMSLWRFKASTWLAALSVPMYLTGLIALYHQIAQGNQVIANGFGLCAAVGVCGGLFIHAVLCYLPIISKTLSAEQVSPEPIEKVIHALYKTTLVPLLVFWLLLVVGTSGFASYAILTGVLHLPWYFVFFTPTSFVLAGILLRLMNKETFADLPGICSASLGLGMLGLMAALNTIR